MGTIPFALASMEVVIRLQSEKDVADVNQSFSSAHPNPAGLICRCTFGNVHKDNLLPLLHLEKGIFFLFSCISSCYIKKQTDLAFLF